MKKFAFAFLAASFATGAAMAQSGGAVVSTGTAVESVQVIAQDYTFDLDRLTDASLAPLPADAGDYEIAAPGEVAAPVSYTFDLE